MIVSICSENCSGTLTILDNEFLIPFFKNSKQVCNHFWNAGNGGCCRGDDADWTAMALIEYSLKKLRLRMLSVEFRGYHEIRDCLFICNRNQKTKQNKKVCTHSRGEIWWLDDPGLKVWSITMKNLPIERDFTQRCKNARFPNMSHRFVW